MLKAAAVQRSKYGKTAAANALAAPEIAKPHMAWQGRLPSYRVYSILPFARPCKRQKFYGERQRGKRRGPSALPHQR